MSSVYIEAVGLYGAGLIGWEACRPVLAGDAQYQADALPKYKPQLLPANERRRASSVVRLAFGACEDAVGDRLDEACELAAVFAASGGDYGINDQICRALLQDDIAVSPTQFHNSVHNAAAGYWSIASKSQAPSVSLSAYDFSVSAGLMEAVSLVVTEGLPTLLAVSDSQVIPPMHQQRSIDYSFGAALWLTPQQSDSSLARMDISLSRDDLSATTAGCDALEALRTNNPAARIIPILELLARASAGSVVLANAGTQGLQVMLSPC